ncbi:hypothetical protein ACFWPK_04165 [Nocardia sp. NPDC058519]|uniref:hypothetical protein n=1 Tax=Nocardia sp. NPDC058519 TaxID=3346535 RepID=UPI0036637494
MTTTTHSLAPTSLAASVVVLRDPDIAIKQRDWSDGSSSLELRHHSVTIDTYEGRPVYWIAGLSPQHAVTGPDGARKELPSVHYAAAAELVAVVEKWADR